ncbi:MAG: hypothetical protein PVJ43_02450 [Gemmatimonadales bacterium]|jgi:hypothetical protein
MGDIAPKVFVLLVALTIGYCAGFKDAQVNESMVFVRVIERVQNFGERTVGDRARETEEAAEGIEQ